MKKISLLLASVGLFFFLVSPVSLNAQMIILSDSVLTVYPNPSLNSTVTLKTRSKTNATFSLWNAIGNKLFQTEIINGLGYISPSDFPQGTYMFMVVSSDRKHIGKISFQK